MTEVIHPLFLLDPSPSPGAGRDAMAPRGHRTQRCRLHKWKRRNGDQQMERLLTLSAAQPPSSFVHGTPTKLRDVLPTPWKVGLSHGWR